MQARAKRERDSAKPEASGAATNEEAGVGVTEQFRYRRLAAWMVGLALALGSLVVVPQFRAADTLPSQLSDEAFWKIIEDFSEDNGFFTSENFSSNERGYQTLIPKLLAKWQPGNAYMGVGPEQNFQYIASLKPKIAFIVDIRRQNMIQHLMYKAAFEMSENRADFLSVVFSRKRPAGLSESSTTAQLFDAYLLAGRDAELAETNRRAIKDLLVKERKFRLTEEDLQTLDHVFDVFAAYGPTLNYSSNLSSNVQMQLGRGGGNNVAYAELMTLADQGVNRSYLASEDSFRFMKDLEKKNLLIPVVGNFGGPKAIRAVGQYLKEHGATVGAFYLSNVEQYLFRPPTGGSPTPIHREFYESVATLPLNESSMFIRSGNAGGGGRGGGLTPMMSSILDVLGAFKEGRINAQQDVLSMSTP
jgi:hypothetical protein